MNLISDEKLEEAARTVHDALRDEGKLVPGFDKPWVLMSTHEAHLYREAMRRALWACGIAVKEPGRP